LKCKRGEGGEAPEQTNEDEGARSIWEEPVGDQRDNEACGERSTHIHHECPNWRGDPEARSERIRTAPKQRTKRTAKSHEQCARKRAHALTSSRKLRLFGSRP
jgi:hypothetical protein